MNIVQEPWLPFRMKDGSEKVLPLANICHPEVLDFALPRADFQGAAYQFAIGLLQTVFSPEDDEEWGEIYHSPPSIDELQQAFDTVAHAFNAVGEGPLFMQDYDPLGDQKPTTVAGLLIEAPGANGIKQNTDHFIKRGVGEVMSLEMAVLALFTLQINGPAIGAGYRVGLRGGGPLTSLVVPQTNNTVLWQKLWINVINREYWSYKKPNFEDGSVFPWLVSLSELSKQVDGIYHTDVHPLHMFWAMPNRIRLLVEEKVSECEVSGLETHLSVKNYLRKKHGANYCGNWEHPLTPYSWSSKNTVEERVSIKGQQGGISYKTWDVFSFTSNENGHRCATVIDHYQENYSEIGLSEQPKLWVFGYDLDKGKTRGWYSATMPIFHIDEDCHDQIVSEVKRLQHLANNALWHTRTQIKTAWFDKPSDAKGDTSFIDLAFWQRSEAAFFKAVEHITTQTKQDCYLNPQQAAEWLYALRRVCTDLFDEYALSELGDQRSMAKRIKARQVLMGWLFGSKDIKKFSSDYKIPDKKDVA